MAISHDIYLFNAAGFAAKVRPFIGPMDNTPNAYEALRAEALRLFDASPCVRSCCDNYGSWDRAAIEEDKPIYTGNPDDIAFWLLLFLYDSVEVFKVNGSEPHGELYSTAKFLNWSADDQSLLTNGKSFRLFAEKWLYSIQSGDEAIPDYWTSFRPVSTAAHMGWLDHDDIGELLAKLNEDEARILTAAENIQISFSSTRAMLSRALQTDSCLCLIQSG